MLILIGRVIAQHRWALALSCSAIAKEVGVSVQTFESIERGEIDLDIATFWRISEVLKATPACLWQEADRLWCQDAASVSLPQRQWLDQLAMSRLRTTWRRLRLATLRRQMVNMRKRIFIVRDGLINSLPKESTYSV